ncbi:MAG: tetratricopeptide repeat protein [Clostridia bacterium]|nr:tetratricopeptide repeat protein [Clostridia bacterium]
MGLLTVFKAQKARKAHQEGRTEEAMKLYQEVMDEGNKDPAVFLPYSVLLIRNGRYAEAREMLVKNQKLPMGPDQKNQLFVNYAACVYKMGELQKGIDLLERQHQKQPSGMIYETLGYLYIEAGDAEKALAYNLEAYEYDDEDAITLDNLGQIYYRMLGDKEKAKEYFEKAIEVKPGQIDTLYFLAQYDLEAGDTEAAKEKLEKAMEGRFSPLNHASKDMVQELLNKLNA